MLAFIAVGCGGPSDFPEIAPVTGTVTMDGQPVPNAIVTFQPLEAGRPSYARTDENGRYEMIYTNDNPGARLGKHLVMISTQSDGDEDQNIPRSRETIPAEYNMRSNLERVVEATDNVFDFELQSSGEIAEMDEENAGNADVNAC
jgi:hypothetical protein